MAVASAHAGLDVQVRQPILASMAGVLEAWVGMEPQAGVWGGLARRKSLKQALPLLLCIRRRLRVRMDSNAIAR
jgi:hypothetical protein